MVYVIALSIYIVMAGYCRGINLGWGTGDCSNHSRVVNSCSTGCNSGPWDIGVGGEHCHLLHQRLLLLVELFIV